MTVAAKADNRVRVASSPSTYLRQNANVLIAVPSLLKRTKAEKQKCCQLTLVGRRGGVASGTKVRNSQLAAGSR